MLVGRFDERITQLTRIATITEHYTLLYTIHNGSEANKQRARAIRVYFFLGSNLLSQKCFRKASILTHLVIILPSKIWISQAFFFLESQFLEEQLFCKFFLFDGKRHRIFNRMLPHKNHRTLRTNVLT